MRTVTYGGAVSLDGFLAGVDGSLDWLYFSEDVQRVMTEFWKNIDTILMGRKTYEVGAAQGQTGRKTRKKTRQHPRHEPVMRSYVFSRTLTAIDAPGVELVRSDAVEFVRDLKTQSGKGICLMGGGELAQSLLAADLVDQVDLNVHPILLGSGIPVLRDPGHRIRLALTGCRPLDGGCFLAQYRVLHAE